jgi:hypothetical protein
MDFADEKRLRTGKADPVNHHLRQDHDLYAIYVFFHDMDGKTA